MYSCQPPWFDPLLLIITGVVDSVGNGALDALRDSLLNGLGDVGCVAAVLCVSFARAGVVDLIFSQYA